LPAPPKTRGAPSFAPFAKGGSVELSNRRASNLYSVIPSEERSPARGRSCAVEGPCVYRRPARNEKGILRMILSGRVAHPSLHNPPAILRQRSPWQSQGLPSKDLCTSQAPPETRGAPSFALFAKGGSVELNKRRASNPNSVIPSEERSSARGRSYAVEGPGVCRCLARNQKGTLCAILIE
jgi:hypothetical protein